MTWNAIATLNLTQDWQQTPAIAPELGLVRLTFFTAGVPVEICQIEPGSGDIYDRRRLLATSYAQILEFDCPVVWEQRAIALRLALPVTPFTVTIEASDMPISRNNPTVNVNTPSSGTVNATSVNAGTASTQLLAANDNRKMASFTNTSTGTLYIDLAATVSTAAYTVALATGDYFELPINYTGVVSGIWANTNGGVLIREYV